MKDFINIDSTDRITKLSYIIKRNERISFLIDKEIKNYIKNENIDSGINEEFQLTKVYKSYAVKDGDTLKSISKKILLEYPETSLKFNEEQLIEEVRRSNKIKGNILEQGIYLTIPYFIPKITAEAKEIREKNILIAMDLEDYIDYIVLDNDTYGTIANLYTNKEKEIVSIVSEIQKLNDYETLKPGMIIKIPNIEKYKLLNSDYK